MKSSTVTSATGTQYTRIKNDINGNSRLVVHFFRFISDEERLQDHSISYLYELALKRARKIGGRKFHNKQFGGGIVFQAYTPDEVERAIQNHLQF